MAVSPSAIKNAARAAIATDTDNFTDITPEMDSLLTAVADAVAAAVNTELAIMKTKYNTHIHPASVGVTTPTTSQMT